ncbi:MAG TPA: sulfite exporter TauE/SafE family protein [Dehalococcoidia bacterium]|nr:sulfite exporter TauE/SafE family protein [Dehalococcoidia bacterium]
MFSAVEIAAILLIGATAGLVTGIIGSSGVMVIVPALTLSLSYAVHTAIGTSLLITVVASSVTAFVYYRHGNIYVRPALWIALASIAGAQAGSAFADMIPPIGMGSLFGFFLIPMGLILWVRGVRKTAALAEGSAISEGSLPAMTTKSRLSALGLGLFVGITCGLFGAGGGIMFLLILVFVLHYPLHLAVGTSSLIMAITAFSGAMGYSLRSNIDVYAALIASVPTVLVASSGARWANRVSPLTLGRIIGTMLVALGIAMIVLNIIGEG